MGSSEDEWKEAHGGVGASFDGFADVVEKKQGIFMKEAEARGEDQRGRFPRENINADHGRAYRKLNSFKVEMAYLNKLLILAKQPVVIVEEFIGARLYTGPLFVKYNGTLRAHTGVPFMQAQAKELCEDNAYVTTLHVINSALLKLGKVMKAQKVYRGMVGGRLPPEFWIPNAFNVRGGVEFGFMSTTTARSVALQYAKGDGSKLSTVFEIQLGMVDRGADLFWLSQYPHEREICLSALTGLEVQGTQVESSILLVDVRLSVNLVALTIDQVIAKRKTAITSMVDNVMSGEVMDHLATRKAQSQLLLKCGILEQHIEQEVKDEMNIVTHLPADFFNSDENFEGAVAEILQAKTWLLHVKAIASPMHVLMLMGAKVHKHKFKEGEVFRVIENQEFLNEKFPENAEEEDAVLTETLAAAGQICFLEDDWNGKGDRECFAVNTYKTPQENLTSWAMQADKGKSWQALIAAAEAGQGDPSKKGDEAALKEEIKAK